MMDQVVSGTKCCCIDDFLANATITGTPNGTKVSLSADLKILRGNCPTGVAAYFWWDCFTAQHEGNYSWWHGSKTAWQAYGWRIGSNTASGDHVGGRGSWFGYDPSDSLDWNWQAILVYIRCENGHLHARGKLSNYFNFPWNKTTKSWSNGQEPPIGSGI